MQMANTEKEIGGNTSISNSLDHLGMYLIKEIKDFKTLLNF